MGRVWLVNRLWATRLAAPAAFLLGITVAILLVRAGLDGEEPTTTVAQTPAPTTMQSTTARTRTATQAEPVFVEVESGDTLDQIALENDTTVEALLTLNQGLDPNALQVGQRVRVR
jgi:LysM repeat protein